MRAAILAALAALIVAAPSVPHASHAGGGDYKVIVHPRNPVREVERAFLRGAYLKKATTWNGETVRPVDLPSRNPVRDRFTTGILGKTPAQLRSYWNQQIFSGKGVPPPEAAGPAEVIAYVLAHPGAVGYIPQSADPGKAKVVPVH